MFYLKDLLQRKYVQYVRVQVPEFVSLTKLNKCLCNGNSEMKANLHIKSEN